MGRNLGPLNIKDTYEGLVQITSGSILTDGSGSDITYVDLSASFASQAGTAGYANTAGFTTSASWAETSGYANTAGEGLANFELAGYNSTTGTITLTRSNATQQNVVLSSVPYAETSGYANQAGTAGYAVQALTASYAEYASGSVDVNAMYTASVVDATITFEKGDTTTFPITINNVANADFASQAGTSGYASTAGFANQAGTAGYAATASYAADYLLTASYSNPDLTFTKGDGSTFSVEISTDTPNLQQVTDVGNSTTNAITSSGAFLNGDVTISGDLDVNGTITYISSSHLQIGDNVIEINYNRAVGNSGLITYDTTSPFTASLLWDATEDRWIAGPYGNEQTIILSGDTGSMVVLSASYADYAAQAGTAGYATDAGTSSYSAQAGTSGYAVTASYALTASSLENPVNLQSVLDAGNNATQDMALTGSVFIDNSGTASTSATALKVNGGLVHLNQDGYNNAIAFNMGNNTLPSPLTQGNLYFVGGNGNTNNATTYGFLWGESSTINAPSFNGMILGTYGGTLSGNYSALVGGQSNVVSAGDAAVIVGTNNTSGHARSVVIGGSNLSTQQTDEVVVPNLNVPSGNVYGTGSIFLGDNRSNTFDTATTDYSAQIASYSSSMSNGNAKAQIATKQSNNTSTNENNVQIGTREANMTATGVGNGQYSAEYSTLGGATAASVILGGYGNSMNNAGYSSIMGGESNTVNTGYSHVLGSVGSQVTAGSKNVILGGESNTISGGNRNIILNGNGITVSSGDDVVYTTNLNASGSVDISGSLNVTGSINHGAPGITNTGTSSAAIASKNDISISNATYFAAVAASNSTFNITGENNGAFVAREATMTGNGNGNALLGVEYGGVYGTGGNRVVIGGYGNTITNGGYDTVIGGETNSVTGGGYNHIFGSVGSTNGGSNKNVILGGESNSISGGTRNVIIGGTGLSISSLSDTVMVPNLVVSGSAVSAVQQISIASNTGSMDCSTANFFEITLQNGVDTRLEASNIENGQTVTLKVTNNGTAAGTLSYGTNIDFANGTPFVVTSATNAVDIITFVSFDSTLYGTGLTNFS